MVKSSAYKKMQTWKVLKRLYAFLNCFPFAGLAFGRNQIGLGIPKTEQDSGRMGVTGSWAGSQ